GYNIVELLVDAGLASTKSEARRLGEQGGAFVDTAAGAFTAVDGVKAVIGADRLSDEGRLVLRAGKKRYCRVSAV
ncbi:MAG: tyrosine--tRNA ligase, partial [Treponema sp.]|nr:tyrosine--tRNA ligase [Treponema sp.]